MTEKTISIADLDIRTPMGAGVEIEVKRADGSGTGVFITVLGEQSDKVEAYLIGKADARAQAFMESRSNKRIASSVSAKATMDDEIESAVVRTAGWRGLAEDYSPENARKLYTLNRSIARQVILASADETLFTKA